MRVRQSFDGQRWNQSTKTVRQLILETVRHFPGGVTAWKVARLTDCRGGTVSSEMFKMMRRGTLVDMGRTSPRGGRIYKLP